MPEPGRVVIFGTYDERSRGCRPPRRGVGAAGRAIASGEGARRRHRRYLGALDIHLARLRWPRAHLVLDQMLSMSETVADRGLDTSPILTRLLTRIDRAATGRADTILVDTAEQVDVLQPEHRDRAVVVRVGAPKAWFEAGSSRPARPGDQGPDLSVVFFGLYTPLQGTR